jgi:hypothetical protein
MAFRQVLRCALLFMFAGLVDQVGAQTQPLKETAAFHAETIQAEFRKGIIVIPCSLGGIAGLRCVLDTGSTMTGLSPELTKKLKLTSASKDGAPVGCPEHEILPPQKLQIGTNTFTVERTGVAPLSFVTKAIDEPIDVLLGTSVFEQAQITVDPGSSEVRFAAPGTSVPASMKSIQVIRPLHSLIMFIAIETTDGQSETMPAVVDTGSIPTLLLGKPFLDVHKPIAVGHQELHKTANSYMTMTVNALELGAEFHDVPAEESLDPGDVLRSKLIGAIIGAPLLNRFVITYDLGKNAMYAERTKDFDKPFEPIP